MGILILGAASNDFSIAFAAEEESFSLDQVVVTATRTEKAIIDTPANTQVITGEDIKNGGYKNDFSPIDNKSLFCLSVPCAFPFPLSALCPEQQYYRHAVRC